MLHQINMTAYSSVNFMFAYRQDEVGTPFRILGTEKTLEAGTVMLQDRDTTLEVSQSLSRADRKGIPDLMRYTWKYPDGKYVRARGPFF